MTGEGAICPINVHWIYNHQKAGKDVIAFVMDNSSIAKIGLLDHRLNGAQTIEVHYRRDPRGKIADLIYLYLYWGEHWFRNVPKVLGLETIDPRSGKIPVRTVIRSTIGDPGFKNWIIRSNGWCSIAIVSAEVDVTNIDPGDIMSARLIPQLIS